MTTKEVIDELRRLIGRHRGSEKELLEALVLEADCWSMRLEELDDDSPE